MSWETLIPKCIEVLELYNPIIDSPDTHFQRLYSNPADKNEAMFIQQVFYNVNRYREFLKRLNKAIFTVNSTSTNAKDAVPFMIFSYLALFRLEELGLKHFRHLVDTQEPLKMHVLLSFIFNGRLLREHVRDSWMELYDWKFIDEEIIAKAEAHYPEMQPILNALSIRATGHAIVENEETVEEAKPKKVTEPQPFNLSQSKRRPVFVEEEEIPQVKATPINTKIFQYSLKQIEKKKQKRREETKAQVKNKYDFEHDPLKRLFAS